MDNQSGHGGDDLSDQVESQGQLVLQYGTNVLVLNMADGADSTEPYDWVGTSKSAAFYRAIPAAGAEITLTINGFLDPSLIPKVILSSNIGTEPGLIPNLRVVNPFVDVAVDIGTEPGLAPNLRVVNPLELATDIGTESGLIPDLHVLNPFSLDAWERVDYAAPIVLASLRATVAAPDITVDPVVIADGELDVVTGLMITQVERYAGGSTIRLRRSQAAGTVNFNTAFGGSNIYAKAKLIIVLDDDNQTHIVFNQGNQGGGFSNWSIQDATQASLINDIATGDDFLLAIALPATALGVSIGSSPALAPNVRVFNPVELNVDIGTEPVLAPNVRVFNPGELKVGIAAELGLAPNLRVVNPLQFGVDIGIVPGLAPNLRVANPLRVSMGAGAGALPKVFVSPFIDMNVSMGAEAGLVSRLFDIFARLGSVSGAGGVAGLGASLRVGTNINVAVSMGGAASSIQNLVVSSPTIIVGSKPMIAWAMEITGIGDMKVPYRVWSGFENLDWNGEIWDGTQSVNGSFVAVSPVTDKVGTPNRRASVSISVNAEMTRELLAIDTGPVSVFLRYLYSLDNGLTWIEAPMALAGRLSQPKFEQGLYTVEIETWSGDADRGEPKFWSDETQRAEYPGDKGFEFVRGLSQGLETRWPP